jgi:alkanesulfonate monooxygenase SsuD/methylene tetrahydromethanopterin reductase-like flavin-dependent oxidoreductase (luciferase family)
VRLGLVLPEGRETELARLAEQHGLFGVLAGTGNPLTAVTAATYASTATEFARIVVRVTLGLEHPVLIAEEIAVLDNVNNGRTVVLADTGLLDGAAADDEVAVLRESLASRPIQHSGGVWTVPAGLPANPQAPDAISVTPKPPQLEVPFWVTGAAAAAVAERHRIPVLASAVDQAVDEGFVVPAQDAISGDLARDRERVSAWAHAGFTHLFVDLPAVTGKALEEMMVNVSRHLAPEVAMPYFPRVMSQSRVPLKWPDSARNIDSGDGQH